MSSASKDATGAPLKSISATELLKQQKQKQKELLQNRLRRAEEIQKRVLQNSTGPRPSTSSSSQGKDALMSPKPACEVPEATQSPATPHVPTLGRGFSEGDDILFFDKSPPQAPAASALSLSAAKMAALKKLKAKGMGLAKEDPNALKRKRGNSSEISARVEKNLASPEGTPSSRFHFTLPRCSLIKEIRGHREDSPAPHCSFTSCAESPCTNEEGPVQKRRREQLLYLQSEEFQKILNAKSRHGAMLQAVRTLYFLNQHTPCSLNRGQGFVQTYL